MKSERSQSYIDNQQRLLERTQVELAASSKDSDQQLSLDGIFERVNLIISSGIEIYISKNDETDPLGLLQTQRGAYRLGVNAILRAGAQDPLKAKELLRGLMTGYLSTTQRVTEMLLK